MDYYAAVEESYKRGYRAGFFDGKMAGGESSYWSSGTNPRRPCMSCGYRAAPTKFCPNCGKAMKNHFSLDTDEN